MAADDSSDDDGDGGEKRELSLALNALLQMEKLDKLTNGLLSLGVCEPGDLESLTDKEIDRLTKDKGERKVSHDSDEACGV